MNNVFSVKDHFQDEIHNIWNNPKFAEIEVIKRGYGIHDQLNRNSILFIGINPSYTVDSEVESYFINLDQNSQTVDGKNFYPYFKKFADITTKVNGKSKRAEIKWSHMDLLFHRETKQHFINEMMKQNNGKKFIYDQLKLAKKIITEVKPRVIVVSNTKSRDFLVNREGEYSLGFDFKFNEEFGTEVIVNDENLNDVPVFFTSMLSGQRALDNGTYKRLIWHINFVLNKLDYKKYTENFYR